MSEKDQIDALADEVDRLVDRFRDEFNMSYASVVGVLQFKIHLLMREACDRNESEE